MKKCLSILLVTVLLLCLIPTTAVFAAKEQSISTLDLTVTAPIEGEKPSYDKIDGRGYYSDNGIQGSSTRIFKNGIAWYKSASSYFSPGTTATFEGNKTYTVKINLLPKTNYVFAANVSAKINGKTATVETYDDGSILVYVNLTASSNAKTAISKVDLTVVKPVIGKTPTFAKVDTTQYFSEKYGAVSNCSNGVTWTNEGSGVNITVSNPFKDGTKYKVTYYLTAKDGYKFDSNTKCTINGSTASVGLIDSTHITVSLSNLVPSDGKKEIASLSINLTAPKEGEKPDYTKIDGTGYYSDNDINGTSTKIYKNGIAWYKSASSYVSPGTTETFKGGSEYTAKVCLIPKDGYKFSKTVTAKINGKTATVESFDDGSINVSVKLTATKKDHTHTAASSWQYDDTEHWKICSDKNCGSLVGAKEKHTVSNGKCSVCGYKLPVEAPEENVQPDQNDGTAQDPVEDKTDTTESKNDSTDVSNVQEKDDNGKDNGIIIWIIIGAAILLIAGAVVVIVLKKKKQ